MYSKGLVLDERVYKGSTSPPATLEDRSRFGNNGVHTAITWVRLPSGLWVSSFNGTTSKIVITNATSLQVSMVTLCAWVNITSLAVTSQEIISKCGAAGQMSWMFDVDTASQLLVLAISLNGTANLAASIDYGSLGTWKLCTGTFDGAHIIAYVNGVAGGSASLAGSIFKSTANVEIGHEVALDFPILGYIALARIYNYALSIEQIASIYQKERAYFGV